MTPTLLFDLDDTLLVNPIDTFLPEYSNGLAYRLKDYVDPQKMVRQLMSATMSMVKNLEPISTLENIFDEAFYPSLNIRRRDVQPLLDEFYAQDFPKLQRLTQVIPDAIQTVNLAVQRGYQVVLATNPLFPKTANLQRLTWTGLNDGKISWLTVPCYEEFHFAKPNLEFYAELLGQIGWPDSPVVMIGNDLNNDILPAQKFGLSTFWVQDKPLEPLESNSPRHFRGRLVDLLPWLEQNPLQMLQLNISGKQALLANLRATPSALLSLTRSISNSQWKEKPSPKEWCLAEIACHLRDVEAEVNLPRVETVLTKSNPFIAGKNTDVWADERNYIQQDGQQALLDFINQRMNMIKLLAELPDPDWSLKARHAIFGPIRLEELVNITASHDRLHLQTVHKLVKNQTI